MKLFKSLILITISCSAWAQNYIDILHTEYTTTPQNKFEGSTNTTNVQKANVNLTVPIKLKNGNAVLTGIVFDNVKTKLLWPYTAMPVASYTLKAGMSVKHSDKWSGTYLLLPKLASRFQEKISKNDFQMGGLALLKMNKSKNLSYKFGAYLNDDRFGPFLVPLFGFYYQKNKLEMDVIVPSYAKINYSLTSKVTVGINWRATVKSYNLNGITIITPINVEPQAYPLYMHHLSNEVAAHVGYEPIRGIIIRGMAGISLGRSFRVYENNDKIDFGLSLFRFGDDRVPLNTDFANGAFGRVEVAYRYYLKQ